MDEKRLTEIQAIYDRSVGQRPAIKFDVTVHGGPAEEQAVMDLATLGRASGELLAALKAQGLLLETATAEAKRLRDCQIEELEAACAMSVEIDRMRAEVERLKAERDACLETIGKQAGCFQELEAMNLQIRLLQEIVVEAVDQGNLTTHEDKCPGDDTCSCEPARILNEALAGYTEKRFPEIATEMNTCPGRYPTAMGDVAKCERTPGHDIGHVGYVGGCRYEWA